MAEETRYAEMTVDELSSELAERGLPKSGKKDALIARLLDDDVAQGGVAPEAEPVAPAAEAGAPTDDDDGDDEPAADEPKPKRGRRRGAAETTTRTAAARARPPPAAIP